MAKISAGPRSKSLQSCLLHIPNACFELHAYTRTLTCPKCACRSPSVWPISRLSDCSLRAPGRGPDEERAAGHSCLPYCQRLIQISAAGPGARAVLRVIIISPLEEIPQATRNPQLPHPSVSVSCSSSSRAPSAELKALQDRVVPRHHPGRKKMTGV